MYSSKHGAGNPEVVYCVMRSLRNQKTCVHVHRPLSLRYWARYLNDLWWKNVAQKDKEDSKYPSSLYIFIVSDPKQLQLENVVSGGVHTPHNAGVHYPKHHQELKQPAPQQRSEKTRPLSIACIRLSCVKAIRE